MLLKSTLFFVFTHTTTIQNIHFALMAFSRDDKPILKFEIFNQCQKKIDRWKQQCGCLHVKVKALSSTVEPGFSQP